MGQNSTEELNSYGQLLLKDIAVPIVFIYYDVTKIQLEVKYFATIE